MEPRVYYDADKIKANGKSVWNRDGSQPDIPEGQHLIAVMDRLIYKSCPDVTDPKEYQHFHNTLSEDAWVGMDLFLVPEAKLADCMKEASR